MNTSDSGEGSASEIKVDGSSDTSAVADGTTTSSADRRWAWAPCRLRGAASTYALRYKHNRGHPRGREGLQLTFYGGRTAVGVPLACNFGDCNCLTWELGKLFLHVGTGLLLPHPKTAREGVRGTLQVMTSQWSIRDIGSFWVLHGILSSGVVCDGHA